MAAIVRALLWCVKVSAFTIKRLRHSIYKFEYDLCVCKTRYDKINGPNEVGCVIVSYMIYL